MTGTANVAFLAGWLLSAFLVVTTDSLNVPVWAAFLIGFAVYVAAVALLGKWERRLQDERDIRIALGVLDQITGRTSEGDR